MSILTLDNLTIRYGSILAVAGLSLRVEPGEIYGLLGPNGSGKSTTLAAISGGLLPESGTIRIAGRREGDDPLAYRRGLGLVPQELALYEELTAQQNLTLFARVYGLAGDSLRRRLTEVLAFVRLTEYAHRPARTFSGGMQRRLNLACSILHQPALLLLDEPTVGLDIQSREAVFACLRALRQRGTAMVFTTHHLEEAEDLCDRIGIMDQGTLIAEGSVPELCREIPGWRFDGPHLTPGRKPGGRRLERVFLELTGRSVRDT